VCVEESEDSGPSRTEYLLTAVFGLHCGTLADCGTVQLRSWSPSLCPIEESIQKLVVLWAVVPCSLVARTQPVSQYRRMDV